jgi:hypothetical protein
MFFGHIASSEAKLVWILSVLVINVLVKRGYLVLNFIFFIYIHSFVRAWTHRLLFINAYRLIRKWHLIYELAPVIAQIGLLLSRTEIPKILRVVFSLLGFNLLIYFTDLICFIFLEIIAGVWTGAVLYESIYWIDFISQWLLIVTLRFLIELVTIMSNKFYLSFSCLTLGNFEFSLRRSLITVSILNDLWFAKASNAFVGVVSLDFHGRLKLPVRVNSEFLLYK